MRTHLNPDHIDREINDKADAIRHALGVYHHAHNIDQMLTRAKESWRRFEEQSLRGRKIADTLISATACVDKSALPDELSKIRWSRQSALEATSQWLRHAFNELFYSEFSWNVDANGVSKLRKHEGITEAMRRVYNFVASVVHTLEQDDYDTDITELSAEYAEYFARMARFCMGPLDDDRYRCPNGARWVNIHVRSKRRLARLWDRSAEADELQLRMYAQR